MSRRRITNVLLALAPLLVSIGLWEVISRRGYIEPSVYLPAPSEIALALDAELPSLCREVAVTVSRALGGLLFATLVGVPIGLLMGSTRLVWTVLNPLAELLRPLPPIAMIPVAILFFGIFTKMKLVVIFFGCLWPILVNSASGVRHIEPVLRDSARMMNLPAASYAIHVTLMGSLPFVVAGVRISLAIALIVAVAAEMIVGNDGIGFVIIDAERSFQFGRMYTGLLLLMIIGFLLNWGFSYFVSRHLLFWLPREQDL